MPKVAARLYRGFRPERYDLKLDIDPDGLTFSGRVVISGKKVGPPAKRLVFHQKDLKVESARIYKQGKAGEESVEIKRINLHKSFDELRLHTTDILMGGSYRVEIEFSGRINDAMHGIYPCYFDRRRQKLIGTQFESHHAREAFPCIDEPEAKAVFALTLITPKTTVIANTPIKKQNGTGIKQETVFEETPRMSTYLLAFVFGELTFKETETGRGVKVRAYGTPLHHGELDFALTTAKDCIDFFEDYFGVDYPLPKLDMVGLPDFSSGAMENWGLITFRESVFFADPKTTGVETKQTIALVVNHELAHQWFGNLVTMRWWDDLWLNESFANLMEYVATNALYPEWRIWEQFVSHELAMALRRDALPNVQAVRTKVNHPDELSTLFDPAIAYAKGGSILNMLRHWLGDDVFRRGLKLYFDKHRYDNTQATDLWAALGQAAGQNVAGFMDKWLNRSGYPVVKISMASGSANFTASQSRLIVSGKSDKASEWTVPLPVSGVSERLLLDKAKAEFSVKVTSPAAFFNDEGHSYFVPSYESDRHQRSLLKAVGSGEASTINRLNLLNGQSLLERAGLATNSQNLQLLTAYANETEESVWGSISGVIGDAKRLIIGERRFEAIINRLINRLTAKQLKTLGWRAAGDDTVQTLRLRNLILSLATAAEEPAVLAEAKARFAKFQKPADLPPDIREVVYYAAARFGTGKDFDRLLSLYKKLENADERNEIASALTSTRDHKQITTLLKEMTTQTVRLQDTDVWYVWLLRNHYAKADAWSWLKDNWQWIESKFASDKSYDNFARYTANVFSRPEELAEYKAFFGRKQNVLALARAIKLGIEEIEARVAWRKANEQKTKAWLDVWAKQNP